MDIPNLDQAVRHYLGDCIAPSTRATYASAQRRFESFCASLPATTTFPVTVARFAAFLGQQQLKHRTIKTYLSGIRFAQIQAGLGDPFHAKSMPLLEYVLSGIKREHSKVGAPPKPRLPVTLDILEHLRGTWLHPPIKPDSVMLWAATCTGFFGFLRAGEFTVPSAQGYDPQVHLNLADLALDSHKQPSLIRLRIKQSKTDPLRQGADIFLGATAANICPVKALIHYIAVRSPTPGPLFVFQSGTPLTRKALVSHVQSALCHAGISPAAYTGHSLRIGAATTAAQRGLEDSVIQTLGRWKSKAYLAYIKIPPQELASVARALIGR